MNLSEQNIGETMQPSVELARFEKAMVSVGTLIEECHYPIRETLVLKQDEQ